MFINKTEHKIFDFIVMWVKEKRTNWIRKSIFYYD